MATVIDDLLVILGFRANTDGADRFDNRLGRIITTVGKVGAVMAGVGVAAAGFLGKGVIDAASQFEKFETQLTTIEGSSEKARESLDWIADFAKKTPYELDGVTDAFVKLKSYGLDPIEGDLLTSIGNMASGMGKSLDQAVEAVADAVTGENERLKEFGIKASKNKSTGEITYTYNTSDGKTLTKTVQNNAKEISNALQGIMDEKFAGGMDAMSQTWEGTVAKMSDAYGGFLRSIANAGVFDMLKDWLNQLATWVENNEDKITAFALAIAEGFKTAVELIGAAYDKIMSIVQWFDDNSQTIITTLQVIGVIAAIIGAALVIMYAPAIAGFLLMRATGLLSFLTLQGAAIASAAATAAAWLVAFAPFLLVAAIVAVVVGLLWLVYNNWAAITAGIKAEWQRLTGVLISYLSPAIDWVNAKVRQVQGVFSSVVASVRGIWAGLWGGIKSMAGAAIDFVIGKVRALTSLISGALNSVKSLGNFKMPSFKLPSFSGKPTGLGANNRAGNSSSVTQNFNVSSANQASLIAKNSIGNAVRNRNNGVTI